MLSVLTWGWAPLLVDDDDASGLVTGLDDEEDAGDIDGPGEEHQSESLNAEKADILFKRVWPWAHIRHCSDELLWIKW